MWNCQIVIIDFGRHSSFGTFPFCWCKSHIGIKTCNNTDSKTANKMQTHLKLDGKWLQLAIISFVLVVSFWQFYRLCHQNGKYLYIFYRKCS